MTTVFRMEIMRISFTEHKKRTGNPTLDKTRRKVCNKKLTETKQTTNTDTVK